MARKRKRKRGRSWVLPSEAEATPPAAPLPPAHVEAALDESCLSHPSFNLDYVCDDCAGGICRVCSISYRSARLCSECFEVRIGQRRRGGSWHGWVGLLAALFAVAVVLSPYTVGIDPGFTDAFPGGSYFFIYGAYVGSAFSVLFGLGAQDFDGHGKRAGLVAAVMGGLVLLLCVLNVGAGFIV